MGGPCFLKKGVVRVLVTAGYGDKNYFNKTQIKIILLSKIIFIVYTFILSYIKITITTFKIKKSCFFIVNIVRGGFVIVKKTIEFEFFIETTVYIILTIITLFSCCFLLIK